MNIIKLNATNSTNTYLAALAKESELQDEVVVVTNHQEKGRGQRDAVWQSQPFKSLTFSVFKRLDDVAPREQFAISMMVSIAIVNYLQRQMTSVIQIKWPNDIMAEGKKCGGILIENQLRGTTIKATIVGVGLNVNEENFKNLPRATSLCIVSGVKFDIELMLEEITSEIFEALHLISDKNYSDTRLRYEQLLFKKGVLSTFKIPDGTAFSGTIKGVDASGQLAIDLPDGRTLKFQNKEVELVY